MDVLKEKQLKNYDYLSRYATFPFYYNSNDNKYIYGITSQLSKENQFVAHKVKQTDTLESLALDYYGRPDFYWIIADFNRICDPFIKLFGNVEIINIPTLSNIEFK